MVQGVLPLLSFSWLVCSSFSAHSSYDTRSTSSSYSMDATSTGKRVASSEKAGVKRDGSPGILARPERFLKSGSVTPGTSGSESGSQTKSQPRLQRYSISSDVKIKKTGKTLDEATIAIGDESVVKQGTSDKRAKSTPLLSQFS